MANASVSEWSTTAGSNTEIDGISLAENVMRPPAVNNAFREMMSQIAAFTRRGSDLASAATLNLDSVDTEFLDITGTTTVTAVTLTDGHSRRARATGAFQLTASATLVVNGSTSTNYTTTAGDLLFFEGYSASTVRVWVISGGASSVDTTWQSANSPINLGVACSVSGNALTIAIKGADGNDPSASNKVYVPFRNVTATSGDLDVLTISAATSLVISSGSTLGAPTSSTPFVIYVVGFNDGGTFRLGAILCTTLVSGALTQYPLAAWGIASSTAEGGAGAADTAQTFYTGSAVTSKAYTVLARLSFESGLATAGTWAAAPTRVQLFDAACPLPGKVLQNPMQRDGATASGATGIPIDDTIPQNTEGIQFMSLSVTPSSAASILRVRHSATYSNSLGDYITTALFRDTTANAVAANTSYQSAANSAIIGAVEHMELASAATATTYKIRAGSNSAGTIRINAYNGGRVYGGVAAGFIGIEEIAA